MKVKKLFAVLALSAIAAVGVCSAGACAGNEGDSADNTVNTGNTDNGTGNENAVIIRLNKTELTLEIGETATLTADISPDPSLIKSLIFSASPEGIVTVDNNGNITAVSQGTAVVSATAGGTTATCTVTVNAVSTVDVAGKSFVLDDIVVDGWSDALIEQTKRQVAGTTFTFSDDGSVSIVWRSFVETGTYTQDGTDVTIHITDAVLGGTPQDIGDGFTVNITLDGDKLLSPVFNEKGENIGYQIYVIKTEE